MRKTTRLQTITSNPSYSIVESVACVSQVGSKYAKNATSSCRYDYTNLTQHKGSPNIYPITVQLASAFVDRRYIDANLAQQFDR